MSSQTYILPMPYYKRNSKALLNLNVFRNLHHRSQAKFKREYGELLSSIIAEQPVAELPGISIEYTLHTKPTRGKPIKSDPYRGSVPKNCDLGNLLTMVSKVFEDELVKSGMIPDDTLAYIQHISYRSNPWSDDDYISVIITESTPVPDPRRYSEANVEQ